MEPRNKGQSRVMDWLLAHANYSDPKCLTTWPFYRNPNGYCQVRFNNKSGYAHRIICELAHGAPPTLKHEAAHKCGNGHLGCVNPTHLAWKTKAENRRESTAHGRGTRTRHKNGAKLSQADVAKILALRGTMRQIDIAAQFNVSWQTISGIFCGRHHTGHRKINLWTAEENQKLRTAIESGLTFSEVAARLGKKKTSVVSHAYRLGLNSRSGHHACRHS